MRFRKVSSSAVVADHISKVVSAAAEEHEHVVVAIPGGSNIATAVMALNSIDAALRPKITVLLSDERYGTPGHADSNFVQLQAAGLATEYLSGLNILSGQDLQQTTKSYNELVTRHFQAADWRIAFLGMGADGHTAGILPRSAGVESDDFVTSYDAGNFLRITMTPRALTLMDCVIAGAFGAEKQPALDSLQSRSLSLADQPAQLLWNIPDVTIYNDQIGDEQ